jgi:aldehyde dehydrogenase (NAD+)
VLGAVAECTEGEVDRAVDGAAKAFPTWASRAPDERALLLTETHRLMVERSEQLADVIVREVGMPRRLALRIQVGLPTETSRLAAELATRTGDAEELGGSLVL